MSSVTQKSPTKLLPYSLLDNDQIGAVTRLYEQNSTLLVAGMGAGKTVMALTAIEELVTDQELDRVLVVAPLRVCNEVWRTEASRWEHLQGLSVDVATGFAKDRRDVLDYSMASVVVINLENLKWLAENYPISDLFDGLVIDEITKLGNTGGAAFKKIRKHIPKFKWRIGMTGTPASEDLIGLFGQMFIVDGGTSLGRNKQKYLSEFFVPLDYDQHQWAPRESSPAKILKKIATQVHVVPDYTDTLPPLNVTKRFVKMTDGQYASYRELANTYVLGEDVAASNAAVLSGKLQQAASGFVYTDEYAEAYAVQIHDHKFSMIAELLETARRYGQNVMLIYEYREQLARLRDFGRVLAEDPGAIDDWNAGRVPVLLAHPKSCGHGLNLQHGGARQIWCGPTWSRGLWLQTMSRLWRRGQRAKAVSVDVIICENTVDDSIYARSVEDKAIWGELFNQHMKELQK